MLKKYRQKEFLKKGMEMREMGLLVGYKQTELKIKMQVEMERHINCDKLKLFMGRER